MKQIKIADDLYDRIKTEADGNFRSIGGQIEFMEANQRHHFVSTSDLLAADETPLLSTEPEPTPTLTYTLPRDKQILQEITALQEIINSADPVNQDPDYWDVIEEHKKKVQELWSEWHEATGR